MSRGLGDVYKRQGFPAALSVASGGSRHNAGIERAGLAGVSLDLHACGNAGRLRAGVVGLRRGGSLRVAAVGGVLDGLAFTGSQRHRAAGDGHRRGCAARGRVHADGVCLLVQHEAVEHHAVLRHIAVDAQRVLLAENPVKEQIIAMKSMSTTMQSIINLYARKHVEDKSRLDLKIMELRLQLDAAEKLPVVKGHEEESEKFKDFLSKTEGFLKIVQDARQKNSYADEDFEEISSYGLGII